MPSKYQRARRYAFWRGLAIALALFTAWMGAIGYAGMITAEQPSASITHPSQAGR